MKKAFALIVLMCLMVTSASAAYIPESVISENRNGRQLIIKTYTLSPTDDPAALVEAPFEIENFQYAHLETVKEEQTFRDTKQHSETVTVNTDSNSLETILEHLEPSMEYSQDGYTGVLTLDHTTLSTEAAGYTTQSYTISDTKQYTDLDRNDPAYVPTTSVKNGTTLTLSNLTWSVTGTGLSGESLVPTSYTATATYTAKASRRVATGYITTAKYTGEISAEGVKSIRYTVTYLGTPIVVPTTEPDPAETVMEGSFWPGVIWLIIILGVVLLIALAVLLYMFVFRANTTIYAMNAKGVAYKKLGRQRISVRQPRLDFTRLHEYPAGDASVELECGIAHKLAGRLINIRLYDGNRTHLVEPYEGDDNYWFAVKEDDEKEAIET